MASARKLLLTTRHKSPESSAKLEGDFDPDAFCIVNGEGRRKRHDALKNSPESPFVASHGKEAYSAMQGSFLSSPGVSLGGLLPDSRCFGGQEAHVTSCCGDSRQCKAGDVFIAIVGARHDGHDHVQEAVERGAVAVVAERPLPSVRS